MNKTSVDEVTQYELETWGRCADNYLDTFAGLTSQAIPLLLEAAEIRPGSHVLDLGSGPGHGAEMLAQAGAVVTGVDFSPQMVKTAQSRHPHIMFREANAEQIPFDDAVFDAVVSNYVVHHLARPEVVFREISRDSSPVVASHSSYGVFRRNKAVLVLSSGQLKRTTVWRNFLMGLCSV